jgi:hypothetical protein
MASTEVLPRPATARDDTLTVCAIGVLASMIASVLHEGLGHAAIALLTGAQSGLLTAVAWSSEYDSRLVAAGGTLVNLAAAALFWIALLRAKKASVELRNFLLLNMAFNLFDGTGYFFFSGVTDFGDWAAVIHPMQPHWAWRLALVVVGIAAYFGAVVLVGKAYVQDLGVPLNNQQRLRRLSILPYASAIVIICLAGLLNPIGKAACLAIGPACYHGSPQRPALVSLLRAEGNHAGYRSGRYPAGYRWISVAVTAALIYVVVLGHGMTLTR